MLKRDFIELDIEEVPVEFEIDIEDDTFIMSLNYNETYDFYTVDLYDGEGEVIVLGEKLVLNIPLFESLIDERLPAPTIVPYDESGEATCIMKENFYKTVFLTFDNGGEDDE